MDIRTTRTIAALLMLIGVFSLLAGCGKSDEEKRLEEAREWELQTISVGKTPPPKPTALPSDLKVVIPEGLEKRYPEVNMKVYSYDTQSYTSFDVKVPGKAKVPGTDYTIDVLNYMPAWTIKDRTLIIKSIEEARADPAIRCIITDSTGKQVFNGFIFMLHKTPSFKTDKYVIGLVGVVDKEKKEG